jgi:hypothetical protein
MPWEDIATRLEWDKPSSEWRAIFAMNAGQRAHILFSDRVDYPVYRTEDADEPIGAGQKGEIVMKYKQSYGDKQRDAQRQKNGETLRDKDAKAAEVKKEGGESAPDADKGAARK